MIWIAIFVANAAILVLEIVGARALTPFFGSSAESWAGFISVVLLGLALGYYFGGRLADRAQGAANRSVLLAAMLGSAGILTVTLWLGADSLAAAGTVLIKYLGLTLSAGITALPLLLVPSIPLAAVSPIGARILLENLEGSGSVVGRVSAVAAAGSVLGSLGVGTLLIPYVGSRMALLAVGVLLVALAVVLFVRERHRVVAVLMAGALVIAGTTAALFSAPLSRLMPGIVVADVDTRYSRILLLDTPHEPGGVYTRTVRTDPVGVQCGAFMRGSTPQDGLPFAYTRAFDVAFLVKPSIERALLVGGCNYSYASHVARTVPGASVDAVEIDEGMTKVAKQYFGFVPGAVQPIHADGRQFLNSAPSGYYDVAFLDAFNSPLATPFQLVTEEAFRALYHALTHDGVAVFNVIGSVPGPGDVYTSSVVHTIAQVFPVVQLYQINARESGDVQNLIIVARKAGTLPGTLSVHDLTLTEVPVDETSMLTLRDDFAPAERLTKPMRDALLYRR